MESGVLAVSAGCLPGKVGDVLRVSRQVLSDVAAQGLTEEELARSKGQLRGGLVLGLEESASRMHRLGESEMFHGTLRGVEEILASIDAVTMSDVRELAAKLFSQRETLAVVGPE